MKCLSIHQPWASLIVRGVLCCEVRSWRTAHRGLLAIHASQKLEESVVQLCRLPELVGLLRLAGYGSVFDLPRGQVLGAVELIDCQAVRADELEQNLGRAGRFSWRLAQPRSLSEPVPVRAKRGIFDIPDLF